MVNVNPSIQSKSWEVKQMQAENFEVAMRDGPRLRYDYNLWVEAKDTKSSKVLIGGLGGFGIGTMWFPMSERRRKLPGFDSAPEMDAPLDYSCVDGGGGSVGMVMMWR